MIKNKPPKTKSEEDYILKILGLIMPFVLILGVILLVNHFLVPRINLLKTDINKQEKINQQLSIDKNQLSAEISKKEPQSKQIEFKIQQYDKEIRRLNEGKPPLF